MNYRRSHKWIFLISAFCLLSTFTYSTIQKFGTTRDNELLFTEFSSYQPSSSLHIFNLETTEIWHPYAGEGDLFTTVTLATPILLSDDKDLNIISNELLVQKAQNDSCSIQLDGWANIKGKMVFVLSSSELKTTFLGSAGDSFESPAFTILSVELKTLGNHPHQYSIPQVTIFDRKLNETITLSPACYKEYFNEIN